MKSLKPRLLTAAIGIPTLVLVIFLSELWRPTINLIVSGATAVMIGEYLNGKSLLKIYPLSVVCIAASFLLTFFAATAYVYPILVVFIMASFLVLIIRHTIISFFDFCYAIFGALLITFGMSAVVHVCSKGISVTFGYFLILMLPWMADTGGFFVGASLGKHKLCTEISPQKTVEGVIGGILFCMISAMVMGLIFQLWIFPSVTVNFFSLIIIGALDAVFSVVGDLSFSLIKRNLGIKDYSTVFPGHGGFLDRCDSIIFTAPIVLVISQFMPILSLG